MSEKDDKLSLGVVIGILAFFFIVFLMCASVVFAVISGDLKDGAQIGVVEVKGTIVGADSVVENIHQFSDDEMIEAILIRVDSPGGSVSASHEIVEAIRGIKKPVVISMGDMAASGAYYVSCAGQKYMQMQERSRDRLVLSPKL